MTVALLLAVPINLFSIAVLSAAIYYRRHHRPDLMLAYIALNVGVFTASALMMSQQVGMAVAFGLFGVLSILRLRSEEINHREVGYFFVALALGLVNGIGSSMPLLMLGLNLLLLATMFVADHPRVGRRMERRLLMLDTVHHDDASLRADLRQRLGGEILRVDVSMVDYVRDTMRVDVRFRVPRPQATGTVPAAPSATAQEQSEARPLAAPSPAYGHTQPLERFR
ncbi:DUF4956 domain-containing protein [Spiractinospora alimapuensis]|uniref:DUF4956 domain-containing protein n=1 Tax=Spiractinospora alimapuensis TaxID=2820884 RepID=UPI001F17DF92|nr:DUF4956 domain-containing protein [Spiractinospora alimapuensis]QVQ51722.1 DUF4956 domain-containing protein [Spiractinospora alimapuensis]